MGLLSVIIHTGNYVMGFLLYSDGVGMLSRSICGKIGALGFVGLRGDVGVFCFFLWVWVFWGWCDISGDSEKHGGCTDLRCIIFRISLLNSNNIRSPTPYNQIPHIQPLPQNPPNPSTLNPYSSSFKKTSIKSPSPSSFPTGGRVV